MTTASVVGTAIAIMLVMTVMTAEIIKSAPMAPEISRNDLLYVKQVILRQNNSTMYVPPSYPLCKKLIDIEGVEFASLTGNNYANVQSDFASEEIKLGVKTCDHHLWKIMSYDFLEGRPFSKEEFEAGAPCVVLSKHTAEQLFGGEPALNKTVSIDDFDYTVVGVVKDVPSTFSHAAGKAWIPYKSDPNFDPENEQAWFSIMYYVPTKKAKKKVVEEVQAVVQRYNATSDWELTLFGPYTHREEAYRVLSSEPTHIAAANWKLFLVLALLFIIPAANLSGFNNSRIKDRVEEIGIRQAYGASRKSIISKLLMENLTLTFIGALIGFAGSFFLLFRLSKLLYWNGPVIPNHVDYDIPLNAAFSPYVLVTVLLTCVLLSFLSTIIPALSATKQTITESLNQNR